MTLQYIVPLEPNLEERLQELIDEPTFMVSSSGIPVLYILANSNSNVTAVDFDKNQFLLLNILASGFEHLGFEDFMKIVLGRFDDVTKNDLDLIVNYTVEKCNFLKQDAVFNLLKDYEVGVSQHGQDVIVNWYKWLDFVVFERLKKSIKSKRLASNLGEFNTVIQFEPDGHYGFIDLSNIREWKYQALINNFPIKSEGSYQLYNSNFEDWDKRLSEFCYEKSTANSCIRNKTFPHFWENSQPSIKQCQYWKEKFEFIRNTDYNVLHDKKMQKASIEIYRKI